MHQIQSFLSNIHLFIKKVEPPVQIILLFISVVGGVASIKSQWPSLIKYLILFSCVVLIIFLVIPFIYNLGNNAGYKDGYKQATNEIAERYSLSFGGLIKVYLPEDFSKPPINIQDVYRIIFKLANEEILLYGSSFQRLTHTEEINQVINLLKKGITVKILFFDPRVLFDSYVESLCPKTKEQAPTVFNEKYKKLESEVCNTIISLSELSRKYNSNRKGSDGDLLIKLTSQLVRIRAYIADPNNKEGKSFFIPTISKYSNIYCPVYECKNIEGGIAQTYHKGIKNDFDSAISIDEFITQVRNTQNENLTDINRKVKHTIEDNDIYL